MMQSAAKTKQTAQRLWTINGDFAGLQPTGVARYAKEVTLALDALVGERHPLTSRLQLDLIVPKQPGDLELRHIPVRVLPEFNRPRLPQFWVQMQLPRHVRGGLVSLCNLAPVVKRRHIVCIHDLHTFIMPGSYGRGFVLAHRLILPLLGRYAQAITTVSSLSRDHLVQYGIAPAEKITVTYNGADHASHWNAARSQLVLGERPYAFFLGRNQKYKNGELIWQIAPGLDALGVDIYLAGDITGDTLRSFGPGVPSNVRLLGRISDDDLAKVLSSSLCLLFPSRIEGFGIPAIEAMQHGCPVIASTSPCLPEVCGEAALYAGPDDIRAWIDAVAQLKANPALRQEMTEKGRARARLYSWRTIAEIYLKLMARLDGEEPLELHPSSVTLQSPEKAVLS